MGLQQLFAQPPMTAFVLQESPGYIFSLGSLSFIQAVKMDVKPLNGTVFVFLGGSSLFPLPNQGGPFGPIEQGTIGPEAVVEREATEGKQKPASLGKSFLLF